MKIWHIGASSDPFRVDGVSRTVWLLSREQARLGHDVSVVIDTPPQPAAIELARAGGITLLYVDATYRTYPHEIRRLIADEKPQLVHMHSVFIVRQAAMARVLKQMGVPYIITPHGGLAPQVLRRGVIKKTLYTLLRERPRFMGSSAVAVVTPAEEHAVRSFIPHYRRPIRWMPNPVEVDQLDPHRWQGLRDPKKLAFLGRFDVLVKGIDILIEIARLLPEMKVELYGTEDPKTLDWLNQLRLNLPANVTFNKPIFGLDKAKMLSGATFYLQPSRWEGFPVSVAECLHLGVPSVIADTLDLAQLFFQHDLGLVIPLDPLRAAAQIRAALAEPNKLSDWSRRGQQFALDHFHPSAVAQKHTKLYEEVLEQHARHAPNAAEQTFDPFLAESHNGNGHGANGHGTNGNGTSGDANGAHRPVGVMPAHLRGTFKTNVSRFVERSNRVFGGPAAARTVVLCYHSINNAAADLAVDPGVFRRQLSALKESGFEFLNFGDLVYRMLRFGPPRNNVACVTFDDGFEDNLNHAAPILVDLGVPATIFVTSGLMARDPAVIDRFRTLTHYDAPYLSAPQVSELSRAGFEIGAHSHTHSNLARLDESHTREEVTRSKAMIEDAVGKVVRSFAYPFGKKNIHFTPTTVTAVRESGFTGAAAVAFRSVTASESIRVFQIPRFFINRSDNAASFEQKVRGDFDWLGSIQESTPTWLKGVVSPEDRY